MTELFLLLALSVVMLIGWQANRARHVARQAGRRACERESVQFLDDTVVQRRWWLARDADGRLRLCRLYEFDYAIGGVRRARGHITLRGLKVLEVWIDSPTTGQSTLVS